MLYRVAEAYERKWSALALAPLAANAVYPFANGSGEQAVLLLGLGLGAAVLGDAMRQRRQAYAERDVALDETAEARRDQAVLAERSRIARELHDVVAHHVSMMVVQAETARVGTPGLVSQGAQSLESIRDTGREALADLRRVLGVLRSPEHAGERSPQPGLDRLDGLVRDCGVRAVLHREGGVRPLPAGVELCAYRIVQEALTNVRRHAPDADADVILRYAPAALRVEIRDNGPGPAPGTTPGFGVTGMRERAVLAGGRLDAGPAPGGGFEVVAELPVNGGPA
jgi:signal transduction histidine kinase